MKSKLSMLIVLFAALLFVYSPSQTFAENGTTLKTSAEPWAQWAEAQPSWVEPYEPFNVIDNIYYVGTKGIPSYLIVSSVGHIVLDGGMPQNAEQILSNIAKLGYKTADVKILLNTHAHFDHSGGLAELKHRTGAKLMALGPDVEALETGLYAGSDNPNYSAPPVLVDAVLAHQQEVVLGDVKLKANHTPGHSPGCTSWTSSVTSGDREYQVLFFCSASVAGNRLVGPPQYEGIVDDYRLTFERTLDWRPDVFLANHSFMFDMDAKRQAKDQGNALAFVDRETFPNLIRSLSEKFEQSLLKQQADLNAKNLATKKEDHTH